MFRYAIPLAGLVVVLQAAAQAPADAKLSRFELTPFAGYRIGGTFSDEATDETLELNDSGAFGVIVNLRESPNTEWEVMYSHQDTAIDIDSPGGGPAAIDMAVDYLQIGGTYLGSGTRARPYMVATLGLAHLDPGAAGLPSHLDDPTQLLIAGSIPRSSKRQSRRDPVTQSQPPRTGRAATERAGHAQCHRTPDSRRHRRSRDRRGHRAG